MAYARIQVLMEKLEQLRINCNNIPFINNSIEIIFSRPQLHLLYEELGSIIQTLGFIHQDHLEKLMRKLIYLADEAEYILDLFLSGVHIRNNGIISASDHFSPFLDLDDVRRSLKSVHEEFLSMQMDPSTRMQNQSAQTSISRSSQKKLLDQVVVGLHRDAAVIRDKLVEDKKKLDVVSIVGMGGIGKTTLATKVFNDPFVVYHFPVRVWVTVSQILESIRAQLGLEKASDSQLRQMVHKSLMGRRYLIVIDDIWDTQAWHDLKLFFPYENMGSRFLLTTRLTEVAKHANSDGLIHQLEHLSQEESWELLCQKVFHGNECPEWSIEPGRQILKNCKGLPLAVLVIAGILAKEAWNRNLWMEIAERTSLYIVGEQNGCLEALGLSYKHLPLYLRECFLYLGGFPEDYMFDVQRLIWLWVAEGFIEEDGNRSLEDIAEGYLKDLIDRNLVIVVETKKLNGGVKACKVHDLVRELCLKKAREEQFILETKSQILSSNVIAPPYKPCRMFINTNDPVLTHPPTQNLRSILWFITDFGCLSDVLSSFLLLRVLDLRKCRLSDFPYDMELLVHLRYLAIRCSSEYFPDSICNLWNLRTLIYNTSYGIYSVNVPGNISDLVNLRQLCGSHSFVFGYIKKPMNLQAISRVVLKDEAHNFQEYFPCIKELTCTTKSDMQNDFKSLTCLERLNVCGKSHVITFPTSLKRLKLMGCGLAWSDMSLVQSLPNLQVLKLDIDSFNGSCWNTDGQVFRQLKYLRLRNLSIKQWEVNSTSFPCLRQLEIANCFDLEEIPFDIGGIPTLELIQIKDCKDSVGKSVRTIQREQHYAGNYDLQIYVIPNKDFK